MAGQETDGRQPDLPQCVTKFIDAVITKMRYRRKVAREVRDELTAHFLDELQQQSDEAAREQAAREMLAEFGDVKLLGILLRRAKKRCRPLWRTVVARTFQAIGVLIICFVLYTIWFTTGKPTISTDYLAILNERAKPDIADADNAWPEYEQATKLYVKPDRRVTELTRGSYSDREPELVFTDLPAERQGQIRKWLDDNGPRWDQLDEQFKREVSAFYPEGLAPLIHYGDAVYTGDSNSPGLSVAMFRFDKAISGLLGSVVYCVTRDANEGGKLEKRLMGGSYMPDFGLAIDANLPAEARLKQAVDDKMSHDNSVALREALMVGALRYWIANPRHYDTGDPLSRLYPYEVEAVDRWVHSNKQCWEHYVKATGKRYYYVRYGFAGGDANEGKSLLSVMLPDLPENRELARLAQLSCYLDLHRGDAGSAIDKALAVAHAAVHMRSRKTLIEQLVGMSLARLANNCVGDIIESGKADANDLTRLVSGLEGLYPKGYPQLDVGMERLTVLDGIQRCFTQGGPGGGHLLGPEAAKICGSSGDPWEARIGGITMTGLGMIHARRDETVAFTNEIFDAYDKAKKLTPFARRDANCPDVDKLLASGGELRYAFVKMLIPALVRVMSFQYSAMALHEATVTIAAIELYKSQHGQYPTALSQLDTPLPMDPYSDKPLVYRTTAGGFTLYSLGGDFVDNGGKVEYRRHGQPITSGYDIKDGDVVYWPIPRRVRK